MKLGKLVAAVAVSAVCASAAGAQSSGPEITVGLGALSYITSDGESAVSLGINQQIVRLGLPVSSTVMIEPTITLNYLTSDGTSVTNLGLGAFVPFYMGTTSSRGLYLAPGAFINYSAFNDDTFGDESSSQVSVAFEVGSKSRISDAVALRIGGQVALALENDDNNGFTSISAIIGLSVKLK